MKKLVCAAVISIIGMQAAAAGDMQTQKIQDWSGFYAGLTAGYGFGSVDQTSTFAGLQNGVNMDGFVGGVVAGYNYQSGSLVFGVEADASLANIEGTSVAAAGKTCFVGIPDCHQSVEALITARARVGIAFDSFMPYLTGGVAMARVVKDRGNATFDYKKWSTGYVVGAGMEYAVHDDWRLRAEFLHSSIKDQSVSTGGFVSTDSFDGLNTIRFGVIKSF
ncbi:MAG: outer membrane protein [Hoeflea sp.]|uniref:outer membrane protein n=1 Tax=Hoeflea sp. TaxID=1940281 RepID=UPI003EF6B4E8